jgi:hypothetical protein
MDGYEQFDIRAWVERGITRHVQRVRVRATAVKQDASRIGVQATIVFVASVVSVTALATEMPIGNVQFSPVLEKPQSLATPGTERIARDAEIFPTSLLQTSIATAGAGTSLTMAGGQYDDTIASKDRAPTKGTAVSTPGQAFGTALQRFMSRQPAQMSEQAEMLADRILAQRADRNGGDGKEWAERVMQNTYQ